MACLRKSEDLHTRCATVQINLDHPWPQPLPDGCEGRPASAWPGQDLSAPASSNGRWFSRKDQNRACGVPHGSAVLPRLGSRQPSGKSIPESPSASVSFQPASGLWKSASSTDENLLGASGRQFQV